MKKYMGKGFMVLFISAAIVGTTKLNCEPVKENPQLTASFLGDSVTYGDTLNSRDEAYPARFGAMTGIKINNYGVCATTIAKNSPRSFIERYNEIDKNSNLIVVAGGSNDFGFNTPIGKLGDTDISTFHGALNTLMNNLHSEYPNAYLIFSTPIHRIDDVYTNKQGLRLEDYANAIIEECAVHGINVVDLLNDSAVDFRSQWTTMMPDGLHPKQQGQQLIANSFYMGIIGNLP